MNKPTYKQDDYLTFLDDVKSEIQKTRIQISRVANRELIGLYWKLGEAITKKQQELGWGKSVVEQLAKDLQKSFEGRRGFSTQNLWYMRQFYMTYENNSKLQQLVGEIPWGQNLSIMSKVKNEKERLYYINSTIEMGWSRNVLVHQIESNAYQRHELSNKQHNFGNTLPQHLAEQADIAMKDVYMLDMLGIDKPVLETQLEKQMVNHIKDVMLELGYGFAFIGNQYRIILCKSKDKFEVEYALRGLNKPIGISKYELTKNLPAELKNKLPDAKQLEQEILK